MTSLTDIIAYLTAVAIGYKVYLQIQVGAWNKPAITKLFYFVNPVNALSVWFPLRKRNVQAKDRLVKRANISLLVFYLLFAFLMILIALF